MDIKSAITPAQTRAARALLGMSREELANASEVALRTLADFESGTRAPHRPTLGAIRTALEAAGVEFISENNGGPGVRLRKSTR
ncbi:MAG: helix-turn-helix domain-containing protein [Alphaproteobacteria bacterium]